MIDPRTQDLIDRLTELGRELAHADELITLQRAEITRLEHQLCSRDRELQALRAHTRDLHDLVGDHPTRVG